MARITVAARCRSLVRGPLPIIDEAHGERLAGYAVSKRLREGQGGAALERLRHSRVIRYALRVRCVARLKCDSRLSKHLAVAFEAHQHRDLHAGTRLLDRRRYPAVQQRGLQLVDRIDRRARALSGGAPRKRHDHQHLADNSRARFEHRRTSLSSSVYCIQRLAKWSKAAPQTPVHQCRSNVGRGVPRTAIAPTTSSQNGSTPKPGIASKASPGNSSHCRPSTRNSSSAVTRSTTHTIGGKGVAKAPMASEMPAMVKARASRFLENLISASVGCLLGSICGGVIWLCGLRQFKSLHIRLRCRRHLEKSLFAPVTNVTVLG